MSATVTPDPNAEFLPPVPRAVRQQAELAERLFNENRAPAPSSVATPATPVVIPGEPAPPEPAPAPAATPAPASDWEQRYRTLEGRFNSEVSNLRGQVTMLKEQILTTRPAAPPQPPVSAAFEPSAEDIETYGPDLINATVRWAEGKMAGKLAELENKVATLTGRTEKVATTTAQQAVKAALAGAVPDWEQINHDSAFLEWLRQIDPFAGAPRQIMLDEAYNRGESARVIAFFEGFRKDRSATTPATGPTPPALVSPSPAVPLDSLAAPGVPRQSGPSGGDPTKRIWRNAEITAFYRDKAKSVYAGREAVAAQIEQDIIAAGREGRVIA